MIYAIFVSFFVTTNLVANKIIHFEVFRRLQRQIKLRYSETATLSDRWQLKDIETVLAALAPIVKAFILPAALVSNLFMAIVDLHFARDEPLGSPLTQPLVEMRVKLFGQVLNLCLQGTNIIAGIYNLFATASLMYSLPSLRALLCADLSRLVGRQIGGGGDDEKSPFASVDANAVERAAVEHDRPFVYLRAAWS